MMSVEYQIIVFNEENEKFEYIRWRQNMFWDPKQKGVLQLEGVPQLGAIWYMTKIVFNIIFTLLYHIIWTKK